MLLVDVIFVVLFPVTLLPEEGLPAVEVAIFLAYPTPYWG